MAQPSLPPLTLVKVRLIESRLASHSRVSSPSYTANEPPRRPSERELIERLEVSTELSRILVALNPRLGESASWPPLLLAQRRGEGAKSLGHTIYMGEARANCG